MKATLAESAHVADRLKDYIAANKISQSELAKRLGVSPAVINQFLSGKYKAKKGLRKLINQGMNLINSDARRNKRIRNTGYVETAVATRIAALIANTESMTDVEGRIGVVIGDGGHGKSECMRQYAEANLNTLYVELDDTMTPTSMFKAIGEKLKLNTVGALSTITGRLITNLEHRHIIIMLDEASGLTVKMLNQLRQIIVVKARCPLILAGNHDLASTIMQSKTRKGYESLDQFTSRLSYILNLDEIAASKDGDGIYTADDIRKLYEFGGIRLTGGAVDTLRRICQSPRSGRLRTCFNVITALHTSAKIRKRGSIDTGDIIAAIEQLGLPVRVWLPVRAIEEGANQETQKRAGVA